MPDIMFAVGEKALLQSEGYPEHNGEYEILEIIPASEAKSRRPGFPTYYETHYRLNGLRVVGDVNSMHSTDIVSWRSLRKIQNQLQNRDQTVELSWMTKIKGWLRPAG